MNDIFAHLGVFVLVVYLTVGVCFFVKMTKAELPIGMRFKWLFFWGFILVNASLAGQVTLKKDRPEDPS